jgi:hypothetical protein
MPTPRLIIVSTSPPNSGDTSRSWHHSTVVRRQSGRSIQAPYARVAVAPIAFREGIRSEPAIALRDGGSVRWLGNFDLLTLRDICTFPLRPEALIAQLCALGLATEEASLLLRWAVEHGLLVDLEAEREARLVPPV